MSTLRATVAGVELHGLLGDALDANRRGRLSTFIVDASSPAIALFAPDHVCCNTEGDWYGEHAGKWLIAAARAAARANDEVLRARVVAVADHLVDLQDADGYLGTYAPERRFMYPAPPKPVSWDGAPSLRTWDVWTHAYLILGLIEVHRHFSTERHLDAARRIGDLAWRTLGDGRIDITDLGNHFGLSATVLMDPAVELYFATGQQRYLDLATLIRDQADRNPALALRLKLLAGADASEIATGKAYQLLWNGVGLAKLHRAGGDIDDLRAAVHLWRNVRDHHLSLGGGPWGGIAHRSREVFNPPFVFSPNGYVETCSILAWMQLSRALFEITGGAEYAEAIETAAYNDLLGAQAPDGEDWCYYSFANGRRTHTTYWRCCKSSGAIALEELPAVAVTASDDGGITVNLLGPGVAEFVLPEAGRVSLRAQTAYPFDGSLRIRVASECEARFPIRIRIPSWADDAALRVGEEPIETKAGDYAVIERDWRTGDEIALDVPMRPRTHRRTNRNVQESRAPDGSPVRQEVLREDWIAMTRGPLVYATGLIDGFKAEETIRLSPDFADDSIEVVSATGNDQGATLRLAPLDRAPIDFVPYYRAGGRDDGAWRITWLALPPAPRAPTEESSPDASRKNLSP